MPESSVILWGLYMNLQVAEVGSGTYTRGICGGAFFLAWGCLYLLAECSPGVVDRVRVDFSGLFYGWKWLLLSLRVYCRFGHFDHFGEPFSLSILSLF